MMNELQIFENDLKPLLPRLANALAGTMPVERLSMTILTACERTPKLLQCDRQSLFCGAMTFAVLGLECDSVTGQGYLVPFEDRKRNRTLVQPIIGYKGYNTLGARAGLTISGEVVREGDSFAFEEGSIPFVKHHKKLGGEKNRRIIAVWATATANNRPPIVKVLSIDEILAVKAKSQRKDAPPWSDPDIGFPAMAEKTAKRRLARNLPLSVYQYAARMEEAHEEQNKYAWVGERGVVVDDGEVIETRNTETPTTEYLLNPPSLHDEARMAAERGKESFRAFCMRISKADYASVVLPNINELKAMAEKADGENA